MSEKLEVGSIVEGKVLRVKPFGAIVAIDGAVRGLVHISQIARGFVSDINEYVKVGDIVKVKVLSVDEEAKKISLSMKDAVPEPEFKDKAVKKENPRNADRSGENGSFGGEAQAPPSNSFEDKMKEWLKAANEKQAVLNKRINKR